MKTQVAIVGAGPAGLFLAHLLRLSGVSSVVIEHRNRAYIEGRVRAGLLEQTTVDLMAKLGLDARLRQDGLVHRGSNIMCDGEMFHVDMAGLADGRTVTIYGQQEVMRDLLDSAEATDLPIVFDAEDVQLHDLATDSPFVTWREKGGATRRLDCDFVAGCDGYHGVSRNSIPSEVLRIYERVYPFGWLGILADVPPCNHELIYCNHERGFALATMRSRTRSRYYIQCGLDEQLEAWPDERFWDELCLRLGPEASANVVRGPSIDKSIAPLRSMVAEPMRYGRLFLAGDAAHIVPPTGAKGLNLAASDVIMMSEALAEYYSSVREAALDRYSERALARVWKAQRFSWWFTTLTHRFPDTDGFDRRVQIAELAYLRNSSRGQAVFAENYVGLPLE